MRSDHCERIGIRYCDVGLGGIKVCFHLFQQIPPEFGGAVYRQFSSDLPMFINGDIPRL
jgi:hypothetical protein